MEKEGDPVIVSLVEDDPDVLALLAELLRAHGHEPREILICVGDTIESGLERLAKANAPVVVMDLGMPVPGPDLLRAAQNDGRFSNVRYLIASAGFEPARVDLPGVRTISKPYEVPELLAAIEGRV